VRESERIRGRKMGRGGERMSWEGGREGGRDREPQCGGGVERGIELGRVETEGGIERGKMREGVGDTEREGDGGERQREKKESTEKVRAGERDVERKTV